MSRSELKREMIDFIKLLVKVARLGNERPGDVDFFISVMTKKNEGETVCGLTFSDMWGIAQRIVAIEKDTGEVWE